jgi:hypothetical protein
VIRWIEPRLDGFLVGLALGVVALASLQVTHEPGESLTASCAGRWVNVQTTQTTITAVCDAVPVPPPPPSGLRIVVGREAVAQFPAIPTDARAAAAALRVLAVDRSVGSNIRDGIACLGVASAAAPHHCRRWAWTTGAFASPAMIWEPRPLPGWAFMGNPGTGIAPELPCALPGRPIAACFEAFALANSYDVVALMPSYLEAGTFQLTAADYLVMAERLRGAGRMVLLTTSSLMRSGTADLARLDAFNQAVRAHAEATETPLLDIADILSHDPWGQPVTVGSSPAITPYYASESTGGHLGYPSAGKIRVAMAWHVALAQIAGWRP